MGKLLYIFGLLIILLLGGSILAVNVDRLKVFLGFDDSESDNSTQPQITQEIAQPDTTGIVPIEEANGISYLEYSEEDFQNSITDSNRKTILFFHSDDCVPCVTAENDIIDNKDNTFAEFTILKINFDEASQLNRDYDVLEPHTFIYIDNDATEITRWKGGGLNLIFDTITE